MRSRQEIQAQAKKNQQAHRRAEVTALALLATARSSSVKSTASTYEVADKLSRSVRDAVVLARTNSRAIGVGRLEAEVESMGLGEVSLKDTLTFGFAKDWERGALLARRFAAKWQQQAVELQDFKAATKATDAALERIAVSESSEAFSAGRRVAARDIEVQDIGSRLRVVPDVAVHLCRVWDAESGACSICADEDGRIVGINEGFPLGEPGGVHAHCRCGWTLSSYQETKKR